MRRLVEASKRHGFVVKVLPSYEQLLDGRVAVQPRAVVIEDLLGRPSVENRSRWRREWFPAAPSWSLAAREHWLGNLPAGPETAAGNASGRRPQRNRTVPLGA